MPASGADGAASEDGAGQNNPVWSEGPWGRAAAAARTEVLQRATSPGTERGSDEGSGEHEGQWQTVRREEASNGKALSDTPALKPYWGKPAVRILGRAMETSASFEARYAPLPYPTNQVLFSSIWLQLIQVADGNAIKTRDF